MRNSLATSFNSLIKCAALASLVAASASCDKQAETATSERLSEEQGGRTKSKLARSQVGARDRARTALDEAKMLETYDERNKAIGKVAWDSLLTSLEITAKAIVALPSGDPERLSLISAYAEQLASQHPDEAIAWAEDLADPAEIDMAKQQIASTIMAGDPKRALDLLRKTGGSGIGITVEEKQVLQTWTSKDPAQAVAWTASLPSGAERANSMDVVLDHWVQSDPAAAFRWTSTQGNFELKEQALARISATLWEQFGETRNVVLEHASPELQEEIEARIRKISKESDESGEISEQSADDKLGVESRDADGQDSEQLSD